MLLHKRLKAWQQKFPRLHCWESTRAFYIQVDFKRRREKFMSRCKAQEFKLHHRKKTTLVKASLMLEHLWMEVVNLIENKRSGFAPHSETARWCNKKMFSFFALHFHDVNILKMNGKWDARLQHCFTLARDSFAWKVISGFAPLGFPPIFRHRVHSVIIYC